MSVVGLHLIERLPSLHISQCIIIAVAPRVTRHFFRGLLCDAIQTLLWLDVLIWLTGRSSARADPGVDVRLQVRVVRIAFVGRPRRRRLRERVIVNDREWIVNDVTGKSRDCSIGIFNLRRALVRIIYEQAKLTGW